MMKSEETNDPQQYVRPEYPLSEMTGRIIAAAQQVHYHLGPGFEEVIYQRSLALELPGQGLDFGCEVWMEVHYGGQTVGRKRVDFLIEEVLGEVKAKAQIEDVDCSVILFTWASTQRYAYIKKRLPGKKRPI